MPNARKRGMMPTPEEVAKYCQELRPIHPNNANFYDPKGNFVSWDLAADLTQARKERDVLKQELERAKVLVEWLLEKDVNLTDYGYKEAKVVFRKSTEALVSINKDS